MAEPSILRRSTTFLLVGLLTFSVWGCDSTTAAEINFYAPDMQTAPDLLLPELGEPIVICDDAHDLTEEHSAKTVEVLERHELALLPDDRHARRKANAGLVEASRA